MPITTTLETSKIRSPSRDIFSSLEERLPLGLASNNKSYQHQRPKPSILKQERECG